MKLRILWLAIGLTLILSLGNPLIAQYSYNVTYDDNGIPHITAPTDRDGVYGQGFEMAKAQGPLLYSVYAKAIGKWVNGYKKMGNEEKRLLRAFVDGINDAMASNSVPAIWRDKYPGNKPDFVNGIEPWHVVAAYMRYSFLPIVERHVHLDDLQNEFEVRHFPNSNSNSWALIDPDGSAWLQVDPHNHLASDEYLMTFGCSMETQQHYRWAGFNALGLPLMGVGVKYPNPAVNGSQSIAWTITAAPPDMADVYEVEWNDAEWKYKFDGRWRRATRKTITIEFPDPNDNWVIEVPYSQEHGPWIETSATGQTAFFGRAVWQVKYSTWNMMKQWNGMLKANNITQFYNKINGMAFHGGNLTIITNSPNPHERINYLLFNPVPDRTEIPNYEQLDFQAPIDGSSSANIWYQAHPFSWLPKADGGDQDHFINCNCSIDVTYPGFVNTQLSWPYYLTGGEGIYTYRQDRAEELWANITTVGENQMYAWVTDKRNGLARYNVPDLLSANNNWHNDPKITDTNKLQSAVNMLSAWDYMSDKNSTEMLLFRLWMVKFLDKGSYGEYFTFPSNRPNFNVGDNLLCTDALNALIEAYDLWVTKNNAGRGTWGKNHLFTRAVDGGTLTLEMPGDACCLRSTHGPWTPDFSHQNIIGGQIVPMMVKLNLSGPPIVKYMKGKDNCTMNQSLVWDNTCPATTRWAQEIYIDF